MRVTIEVDPNDPRDVERLAELARRLERTPAPAPATKVPRARAGQLPSRPSADELREKGVTDLDRHRAEASARRKGALK